MAGKVIANFLSIFVFVYLILSGVSFCIYAGVNERTNDLLFDVAETVSTKGVMSDEVWTYLNEDLSKMGDFCVELKLEVNVMAGRTDTYYKLEDILNRELATGDRLTIVAYSLEPSIFEKITGVVLRTAGVKVSIIV